jgi:hypothetical protein
VGSLLVGGVPYLVSALAAPLLFIPVLAMGIQISGTLGRPAWNPGALLTLLAYSAFFSCVLGYVYVVLVMMLRSCIVRSSAK